ncbi:MAG: hypothetical protein HYZ53_10225 [Planctomycetes bacterium]|nr:hypothetical protein [Planctomycetota bacterium]
MPTPVHETSAPGQCPPEEAMLALMRASRGHYLASSSLAGIVAFFSVACAAGGGRAGLVLALLTLVPSIWHCATLRSWGLSGAVLHDSDAPSI